AHLILSPTAWRVRQRFRPAQSQVTSPKWRATSNGHGRSCTAPQPQCSAASTLRGDDLGHRLMNTEDAPLRKVRQLRGYGAFAVAAVFAVVFLWWAPIASASVAVEIAIVIVIGLCGGVQLWLAHHTPPDTRVASLYSDPN